MLKLRHAVAFVLALGLLVGTPAAALQAKVKPTMPVSATETQTVHIVGHLVINDIDKETLYNYVTNLENDKNWYPGVIGSELIQGDGGEGTTYKTTMNFGQGEIIVTATVLGTQPFTRFEFTSDGFLANRTSYEFKNAGQGQVEFTIDSKVEGTTPEMIEGYMQGTFQGLLNALGKTGEVTNIKAKVL